MSDAAWVWVLEVFATDTDELLPRWPLPGFTDERAVALLNVSDLGSADLYDVTDDALDELGRRFGLAINREGTYCLIGREQA